MRCEACLKPATFKDPVHVVAKSEDDTNYLLICGKCLSDPESWVPVDWDKIVDNQDKVWWVRKLGGE